MLTTKEQLTSRLSQWKIFNELEAMIQKELASTELSGLLNWFSSVWELAREHNPDWIRQDIDQEKVSRLQESRNVFSC